MSEPNDFIKFEKVKLQNGKKLLLPVIIQFIPNIERIKNDKIIFQDIYVYKYTKYLKILL